jgi:hypothetical protein
MFRQLKAVTAFAAATAAVILPLYGDPRSTPVTHAEWARLVLRALELDATVPPGSPASQAFSVLSWRNSLSYAADRFVTSEGVEVVSEAGRRRVVTGAQTGEVSYAIGVPRPGDYRFRVRLSAAPGSTASAEITPIGETRPERTFTLTPPASTGWIDAGVAHLDAGAYTASLVLPAGASLEYVEVAPPCVNSIEPVGGWKSVSVLQADELAVTTLKAIDLEAELPPADMPIELLGSDFQLAMPSAISIAASLDGPRLRAGPRGLQAVVFVDLPEPGLYTVSALGVQGGGQSWLADACRKAVLCDSQATAGAQPPEWRDVLTSAFSSGRHVFAVTLGDGAVIERVRVTRKKDGAADYVATLARLGFDVGPMGPVARGKAVDAMNFISARRATTLSKPCEVVAPSNDVLRADSGLAEPTITLPPTTPLLPGQPTSPLEPPLIPPQDPASPVIP